MDTTALAEMLDELAEAHERDSLEADTDFWRDAMASEALTLREAAARLRAVAGEPVAWMFQHDETGRMTVCPNDGVNTPQVFAELNPRYALIEPLYTHPQPATPATVTDEDVERALSAPFDGYRVNSFIPLKSPDNMHRLMRAALESFANKEWE